MNQKKSIQSKKHNKICNFDKLKMKLIEKILKALNLENSKSKYLE